MKTLSYTCRVCRSKSYRLGKSYLARCKTCNHTQAIVCEDRRRLNEWEAKESCATESTVRRMWSH